MTDSPPKAARLWIWLARPSIGWLGALLAMVLSVTAIGSHRVFDDFIVALGTREPRSPVLPAPRLGALDLFTFTNGLPAENSRLADLGSMLPWWSDPRLEVAFFRPASSLTHWLDEALWPEPVSLHYVQSLVWLGLLVAVVARYYRTLEGSSTVAGLAALLYAVDDAHGAAVAWLSNRNSLIAATLGVMALIAHHRWRHCGKTRQALLAPGWLLAALLAGESALAATGYLFAHAVVLDTAPPRRRMLSLLPYVGAVAVWSVVYTIAGYGASHSGLYIDPVGDTERFLAELPARATALLGAALGPIPADIVLFEPNKEATGLVAAFATLLVVGSLIWPTLRRDRTARFWVLGMLLSAVPACAGYPSDRLLLLVGIGAMGLVARVIAGAAERTRGPRWLAPPRVLGALAIGAVHLALAPALAPARAAQMRLVAHTIGQATEIFDRVPDLARRTVVIINPPIAPFASYIQAERAYRRAPRPAHLYWLASAVAPMHWKRTGSHTLTLKRDGGLAAAPVERLCRSSWKTLQAGTEVALSGMTAKILSSTPDGRPLEIRFQFVAPLESEQYLFLWWSGDRLLRFSLPAEGQTIAFPAEDVVGILLSVLARQHP